MDLFRRSRVSAKPEVASGVPTRTIYIKAHMKPVKTLSAFDLTPYLTTQFGSDAFKTQARDLANSGNVPACLKMYLRNMFTSKYVIHMPAQFAAAAAAGSQPLLPPQGGLGGVPAVAGAQGALGGAEGSRLATATHTPAVTSRETSVSSAASAAGQFQKSDYIEACECKLPIFSSGTTKLAFMPGFGRDAHPIQSKPSGTLGYGETFVFNSVEYRWEVDNEASWTEISYKLVKELPDRILIIGRYWAPMKWMRSAAVTFDENELDCVVLLSTCCAMLVKKMQKMSEQAIRGM